MVGESFTKFFKQNESLKRYKQYAYFFVQECGWSQEDFDESIIEFMEDVISQHQEEVKKSKRKK